MDHRAIAGPDLEGLHPSGLGEAERDDDELVLEGPLGGDLECLRHLEDQLGLADGPALLELPRWWRLGRIAFGDAGIHPGQERADLGVAQPAIVRESVHVGIREQPPAVGVHECLVPGLVVHWTGSPHSLSTLIDE